MKKIIHDSSPFSHLPDEIVLYILNKLFDLKTLCICKIVSKRFYLIIHQVDAITFTIPLNLDDRFPMTKTYFECVKKFKGVKSLHIELSASRYKDVDYRYLCKWKVRLSTKVDSYIYISPNSIRDSKGLLYVNENGHQEEDGQLGVKNFEIALEGLTDAVMRLLGLLICINNSPSLEKVSITDQELRGTVSVSGGKLAELREWLISKSPSDDETIDDKIMGSRECPTMASRCYIPLLELPVSGYVMNGVIVFLFYREDLPYDENDSFINIKDDEDLYFDNKEEEAAYREAVTMIFSKYRGWIEKM